MTDSNDDKTLGGAKKTLTLKPSGMSQGTVRQDMGRGRTKAVVVETRKRRPMRPEDESSDHAGRTGTCAPRGRIRAGGKAGACAAYPSSRGGQPPRPQQQPSSQATRQQDRPRPVVLNHLSPEEMDARRRALALAQVRDAEDAARRAEEEKRRAAEEAVRLEAEAAEAARRAAEEAARAAGAGRGCSCAGNS